MRKRNICTEVWKHNALVFNQLKFSRSNILQLEAIWWFADFQQSVHFQSETSLGFRKNYRQKKSEKQQHSQQNAQKNKERYKFMPSWENSLEHITRGYSGPGNAGGVCSSVPMWHLGAPSILIMFATKCAKSFIHEYTILEINYVLISRRWKYVLYDKHAYVFLFTKSFTLCLYSQRIVFFKQSEMKQPRLSCVSKKC